MTESLREFVMEEHEGGIGMDNFVTLENGFEYRLKRPDTITFVQMAKIKEAGAQDVIVRGEGNELVVRVLRVKDEELDKVWNASVAKAQQNNTATKIKYKVRPGDPNDVERDAPDAFNAFFFQAKIYLQCNMSKAYRMYVLEPDPFTARVPIFAEPNVRVSVFHLHALMSMAGGKVTAEFLIHPEEEVMCIALIWSSVKRAANARKRVHD